MDTDKMNITQPDGASREILTMIGSTPVTYRGWSWIPITQLVTWVFFTRQASKKKPADTIIHWTVEGTLNTIVTLGSEWCHNLAHLLTSNLIGKPMDELRVQMGMPRCIYNNINDPDVSPRQHLVRSLGGPIMNMILLPISWFYKKISRPDTITGEAAKLFYQTNLFLSFISLLPIPGIDGGPILKWSLVDRGCSIDEADDAVRKTNGPLAFFLGLFSSWYFARKRLVAGFFYAMLGLTSLSIFSGWLKEDDVTI